MSSFSETYGNVRHFPILNPVHTLVGIRTGERTKALNIRAHLDKIQQLSIEAVRELLATGVPCCLEPCRMYAACKTHHLLRLAVSAHETYAGHVTTVTFQQAVQKSIIKRQTYVILQLRTMAARTTVRTLGEVKRKRNLSRNVLEDYIV